MRPMRAGGGFGGMFPSRTVAFKLAAALVVVSIVAALAGQFRPLLMLIPGEVLTHFWLWQPFTYAFIETQPLGVIFGAMILWSIGSSLEQTWGPKRLAFFTVGVTVAAGILTTLLAIPFGLLRDVSFTGGTVMTSAVWVAYGWAYGSRQTNFWGMPVTGNMLAGIGILFVVLNAVMGSWIMVIPEVFAIALTFAYVKYGSPSLWMTRMKAWQLQKKLRKRSNRLKIVQSDRNIGGGSDQFLH